MIRICCSKFHTGNRRFGVKEPLDDLNETHGYCLECFEKEKEKIEAELEKSRGGKEE